MVKSQCVVKFETMRNAFAPPAVPVIFHCGKIVKAVAPNLPFFRERVRRNARNRGRSVVFVEQKFVRVCPNVDAFGCDVKRQVADNLNASVVDAFFERVPLTEEFELLEYVIIHSVAELFARRGKCFGVTQSEFSFPLPPFATAGFDKRHIKRIIVQPILFGLRKLLHLCAPFGC